MTKRYYAPPILLKRHAMLATLNVSPPTPARTTQEGGVRWL